MARFLVVYWGSGNMQMSKAERDKMMAAWDAWFKGLGKAVVDIGAPTAPAKAVSAKGIEAGVKEKETIGGYSVFEVASADAAAEMAKKSPHIASGGRISIYSIMAMM